MFLEESVLEEAVLFEFSAVSVSPDLAGGVPLGFVLLELPPDLLDGICDLDVLPDDPDCAGGCPSDVPEVSVSALAAVPIVAVIWLELTDSILPYMVELL